VPEVADRDEKEKAYARLMAKLLKAYGGRLLEKLGDPPDLANLPADFWDEEAKTLVKALSPFGRTVYLDAARQLLKEAPIQIDWDVINERAVDWSQTYTFELVKGLNETTRETVQRAIGDFFEQGMTRADLEEQLVGVFGPVRAEMIAVTEVTRAASKGEQELAKQLAEAGIEMTPIWQTNADELVCELCGPKHDKPITDDMFPPEHPRCRCWVNYELPRAEA
jgi:hypothetical protein